MRPAAVALLLAGLALAGWSERSAPQLAHLRPAPVGSAAAREDAHFRRAVELALATGQAPERDRFLDGGLELAAGRAPPWPALAAAVARRTVLRGAGADELARLEPGRLERLFARAGPALGALAVLAVFAVVRLLHGGAARDAAGLLAAGLYALSPAAVLAERLGRADPAALETLLGCALLACAHLALRGRDELDGTTGALLWGPLAGLALVAAPALTPLLAGCLAGVACADRGRRARLALLALAGAGLVVQLTLGSPRRLAECWPAWAPALPASSAELVLGWAAWVLLPAALVASAALGRARERLPWLAWGALALAWSACFGADAAGLRLAACVLAALAAADAGERLPQRARPLAFAAAVLAAAPSLIARRSPAFAPDADELARRAAWSGALEHLRTSTPSTGPWNHPGAPPDGLVLCAPEVAVEAAVGARRAVFACDLPRLATPRERSARAAEARALLDAPPGEDAAGELARLGVRCVLLGPGDPPRAAGGLAARLAAEDAPAGLERLWASEERTPAGPVAALWAVRGGARGR